MRASINVLQALELYDKFQDWRLVSRNMPRPNGMPFEPTAIRRVVRQYHHQQRQLGHRIPDRKEFDQLVDIFMSGLFQ